MAALRLGVLDVGAFTLSVELAPRVEELGYARYWVAEHHGERSVSNPTLVLPLLAMMTDSIRLGTAGVLLRFQSALAVAENFRMLQHAFAGRIDLGVARAPALVGTEQLRDGRPSEYGAADHLAKTRELQQLLTGRLPADHPLSGQRIDPPLTAAGPPPLWVMSTSSSGAAMAAELGAHYCFHDHYAPADGPASIQRYRREFRASPELAAPAWNVCVAGHCAENEQEASLFRTDPRVDRRTFVGDQAAWVGFLREIRDTYQTDEIVVQTTFGTSDLEREVASFTRIAAAARSLE